ncbi:MAG: FHIPEP family type III secretion protein [Candidatus Sericytochromatia bacterium]
MTESQTLNVLTLSPGLENTLNQALVQTPGGPELHLEPGLHQRLLATLERGVEYCRSEGYFRTAILCDPRVRRHLRRLIEKPFPHVAVISYAEVAPGFVVNNLLTLEL